jgi:drug/metabolite transporter (DMT)-like permease
MPASDEAAPPARWAIWSDLPPATRGSLLMICAAVVFSAMNAIIRILAEFLPAFEIAFFRNFFALVLMLPWVARYGRASLNMKRFKLYSLRALAGLISMLFWFSAVTMIPLAEATALSFTGPIFATMGAALILRETVGWRRWGAVAVGFIGVLIIMRPGAVQLSLGASLALASAVFMAIGSLMVKTLSRTEPTAAIVSFMVIYLAPLSLIPALFVWVWPPLVALPYLVALGFLGALAHLCYTGALAAADASAVMPLDYMRLPAAALFAYLLFAEVPTVWTWSGAGIIVLASTYIAQREMRLKRQRAPAVAAP